MEKLLPRRFECLLVKFDPPDAGRQVPNSSRFPLALPCIEKPFYSDAKEVAVTEGWFQKGPVIQWPIGRVAHKVENELDNLPPRENSARISAPDCDRFLTAASTGQNPGKDG